MIRPRKAVPKVELRFVLYQHNAAHLPRDHFVRYKACWCAIKFSDHHGVVFAFGGGHKTILYLTSVGSTPNRLTTFLLSRAFRFGYLPAVIDGPQ